MQISCHYPMKPWKKKCPDLSFPGVKFCLIKRRKDEVLNSLPIAGTAYTDFDPGEFPATKMLNDGQDPFVPSSPALPDDFYPPHRKINIIMNDQQICRFNIIMKYLFAYRSAWSFCEGLLYWYPGSWLPGWYSSRTLPKFVGYNAFPFHAVIWALKALAGRFAETTNHQYRLFSIWTEQRLFQLHFPILARFPANYSRWDAWWCHAWYDQLVWPFHGWIFQESAQPATGCLLFFLWGEGLGWWWRWCDKKIFPEIIGSNL